MAKKIDQFTLDFEREKLVQPFGFKGGYLDELWQIFCRIDMEDRTIGRGRGVQSVLWADAETFANHSQAGANALMMSITEKALSLLRGREFTNPPKLLHDIFPVCCEYASSITERRNLPATFVLNALVPVDFALWQIWAARERISNFSDLVSHFCPAMDQHHEKLGIIPLVSYHTSEKEIEKLLQEGAFLLKIKIGSNEEKDNDPEKMVKWDIERVSQIHKIASKYRTSYTDCGYPVYYLDANGRYDSRERLMRFLEGISASGALERIVLLEEPFPEGKGQSVRGIPVCVAGDERIHSRQDAIYCLDRLGYGAVALKPIAKTLSVTLEIYEEAAKRKIPCFCADLTVPPDMFEWNMQIAARIGRIPGVKIGVIESNGAQNYQNWEKLMCQTGHPEAAWLHLKNGVLDLSDFYKKCRVLQRREEIEHEL